MSYSRGIGVDSLEYRFDLNPRADDEKNHRDFVIDVTFFPRSKFPTHFGLSISHIDKNQCLAEELSIEQLERLHDFIDLVLKLSKEGKKDG